MLATDTLDILALCGSLRRQSIHRALLKALPPLAPAEMKIDIYPDLGDIPLYNFDIQHEKGFPLEVTRLAERIHRADGVLIASPEYNWSVSSVLKNAIDWISRMKDHAFRNKPILIQTASGGALGGSRSQYHLRQIMTSVDAICFTKPEVFINYAAQKLDVEQCLIKDDSTREIIEKQLAAFARFVRILKAAGEPVHE